MIGQLLMRSKFGSNLLKYSDLMPFTETEVLLDQWHGMKSKNINANFIKTPLCETNLINERNPNGLMIATNGPIPRTIEAFWCMVIQ